MKDTYKAFKEMYLEELVQGNSSIHDKPLIDIILKNPEFYPLVVFFLEKIAALKLEFDKKLNSNK